MARAPRPPPMVASSSVQSWLKGGSENKLARAISLKFRRAKMRFSNALGSKLFRWCSRENHTSVQKLLEVDAISERSKLLNKVSVLMGYSNTQDLIEQERACKESAKELISGFKEIEFPEFSANFPCIKIGDSSPIELYDDSTSMKYKETVLSENLTKYVRESVDREACPESLADATTTDGNILDKSTRCLPGTTSRQYRQLEDGGFHTVHKLLQHFPRTYADLQNSQGPIEDGQYIMLFGTVVSSR